MEVQTLAEHLLFSTIRIKTRKRLKGTDRIGHGVATGFVFAYESDKLPGQQMAFMVTNKHVIADAEEGRFVFIKADENSNPRLGHGVEVPILLFENHWHGHPDDDVDIAVMPLQPLINYMEEQGESTFVRVIGHDHIATPDHIKELDALEEIMFIGYPSGIYDRVNLLPVTRRGATATPLQIDYEGQPVFLIDASVFPGSSGSPVFIANFATYMNRRTGEVFAGGSRTLFLGIVAKVFRRTERGKVQPLPVPTTLESVVEIRQMIDIGVVFTSSTVLETVEDLLQKQGYL